MSSFNYSTLWRRREIAGCRWMKVMNSVEWFNFRHYFCKNETETKVRHKKITILSIVLLSTITYNESSSKYFGSNTSLSSRLKYQSPLDVAKNLMIFAKGLFVLVLLTLHHGPRHR